MIGTDIVEDVSYSTDKGNTWTTVNNVDGESVQIVVDNCPSNTVMFKGNAKQYAYYDEEDDCDYWSCFQSEQLLDVSGNIMSLFYDDDFIDKIEFPEGSDRNCYYLFSYDYNTWDHTCNLRNAKNLVLPVQELTECCYSYMFYSCENLEAGPKLLATILAPWCYHGIFSSCYNLKSVPELYPVMKLEEGCYCDMFGNCSSIEIAPSLPATTLADSCYENMFGYCTSLIIVPSILPATILTDSCYSSMFMGCTSLIVAPILPALTLANYCYSYMFEGCKDLNYIKALFTSLPTIRCTEGWVRGVNRRGTFIQNGSASWWLLGQNGIPNPKWRLQYEGTSTIAENARMAALSEAFTTEIISFMPLRFAIPAGIGTWGLDWIANSTDNGETWNVVYNTNNRDSELELNGYTEVGGEIIWIGSGRWLGTGSSSNSCSRFSSVYSSGRFKIKGKLMSLLGGYELANFT